MNSRRTHVLTHTAPGPELQESGRRLHQVNGATSASVRFRRANPERTTYEQLQYHTPETHEQDGAGQPGRDCTTCQQAAALVRVRDEVVIAV